MPTELVVLRVDSGDSGTLGTRAGTALLEDWGPEERDLEKKRRSYGVWAAVVSLAIPFIEHAF